jgi:hypothetical protein
MFKMLFCFLTCTVVCVSGNILLEKIKDATITCDYLIVCPKNMGQPAISLAEHRNSYPNDDVTNAHVAYLEDIIIEFNGTDYKKRDETLWYALKWASENWKDSLKYLVLIGDDTYQIDSIDSVAYSIGNMPAWYSDRSYAGQNSPWDLTVSDDFYSSISLDNPTMQSDSFYTYPLYIGRIPAQTVPLCSMYVEKVKKYDLNQKNSMWKNNIIAIADDNYQGADVDPISTVMPFQATCDEVISLCRGFYIEKQYLSSFPTDQFYSKPEAKKSIINTINKGAGITFFYGHGNESVLTDELVLTNSDFDRFENDSVPTFFCSFTSQNGSFLSQSGASMCKRYLFKENGGCIAYFASAELTYVSENEKTGISLFNKLNEHPQNSLGQLIFDSKKSSQNGRSGGYFLLGDPALRLFSNKIPIYLSTDSDTISPKTVTLSVSDSESKSMEFNYSIQFSFQDTAKPIASGDLEYVKDSVFFVKTGNFKNKIDIEIPSYNNCNFKAVAYVWNDSTEGRSEIKINKTITSAVTHGKMSASKGIVDVTVINSILTISNIQSFQKTGTLKVFNIQGKLLVNMNVHSDQHRIDLKNSLPISGRYLLLLNVGDIKLQKSFMILK